MAEIVTKVDAPWIAPGKVVDGVEIQVDETVERWTEVTLADQAKLRIKPIILSAVRVKDHFDQDGNPMYVIKANFVMAVSSVPETLKKK